MSLAPVICRRSTLPTPLFAALSATLALASPLALATPATWIVDNCSEAATTSGDHTGSLRYALNNAASGDTIDMTQIGAPVSAKRALRALEALDGLVEQASEQELADAAARADRAGLFTCPHTGVALAALEKLAAAGTVKKNERVVVISTAHGLKFSDFKVGYHEETLPGIRSPLRNGSVRLAPTLGAVQDAIAARVGRG